jgi:prophage regulatory protein
MKLITFARLAPDKGIYYTQRHLARKCAADEFPKPIALSLHRKAWIESEIDEWVARRAAERKAPPLRATPATFGEADSASTELAAAPFSDVS